MNLESQIRQAVAVHLPGREVVAVRDRGAWGRQIVDVTLDDGEEVLVKISLQRPGWLEGGEMVEREVIRLLAPRGLAVVPAVWVVDSSCEILPHPYVIQAKVGGTRLGTLLQQLPRARSAVDGAAIYEALGRVYAGIHATRGPRDGLWNGSTPEEPWGAPTDHMFQAEVVEGSGKRAVETGRLPAAAHARAVDLWRVNFDYLRDHPPALVHMSPFPWTIYLDRAGEGWRVTKLMSVGDFLWWDAAFDVACLRYPPYGEMRPEWWAGFLRGYGNEPERKRLLLYAVMQRLSAAMGCYMEPEAPGNAAWRAHAFDDFDAILDEIEALT